MKNYEKQIEEMRRDLDKKEAIVSIIEKLQRDMEWEAMKYVDDDSEEGHHFEAPEEDDWQYRKYEAYMAVIELIDKKFF